MKVLYIAAECKPFSKVGGVGDVAGELPPELKRKGIDIEVVTPFYGSVKKKFVGDKTDEYFVENFNNERGVQKKELIEIYRGDLDGVPVNLLKNKTYFEGAHNGRKYSDVYVSSDKIPFYDDILRFSFFSEACLQLIRNKKPDIVHVNDWLLGYLFGRMIMEGMPQRRVLTIHNVGYQGNIWRKAIVGWQIDKILNDGKAGPLFIDPHKEWNNVNALKLGLQLSHMANTVSLTYCKEMTKPEDPQKYFEGGKGLHEVAEKLYNEERLIGILNGFSYKFEPTDDKFNETLAEKHGMKNNLGKYFEKSEKFLLGFVGRAVEQKFKLLTEVVNYKNDNKSVLEHLIDIPGVNVAILATGQEEYESFIGNVATKRFLNAVSYEDFLRALRRKNYACTIAFDKDKARQISLGSDIFLMPSLFEPCGITQMESLSYATPPLVRWTGGLVDTVKPHDKKNGTGFGFNGSAKDDVLRALIKTVHDALMMYRDNKDEFRQLQKRGFQERFSWSTSAEKYINELYLPAIESKEN